MKLRKHMISRVLPDSIAEELGLEPGDRLVSVNGQPVEDVFDYRYLMNEELVVLLVEKPDGEEWELERIRKPPQLQRMRPQLIQREFTIELP